MVVLSGGSAASLNVKAGGFEIISAGGFESGSNISSGGTFEAIGNASVTPHLLSGATFAVGSGALASVANEIGVTVKVLSGGIGQWWDRLVPQRGDGAEWRSCQQSHR